MKRFPYDAARAICVKWCHPIKEYLAPLFGPKFLEDCHPMEGGRPSGPKKRKSESQSPREDRPHGNALVGMGEQSKRPRRTHDPVAALSEAANLPHGLGPEDMEAASALLNMSKGPQVSAVCHD